MFDSTITSDVDCWTQASKRVQQCTVTADVHMSPDADSDVTDDVTSAGSFQPPGRYCSATDGSFRRRDRLRSSLPVVSAMNKSMERPLGSYEHKHRYCIKNRQTCSRLHRLFTTCSKCPPPAHTTISDVDELRLRFKNEWTVWITLFIERAVSDIMLATPCLRLSNLIKETTYLLTYLKLITSLSFAKLVTSMNVTLLSGACIQIVIDCSSLSAVHIFAYVCLYTCLYCML